MNAYHALVADWNDTLHTMARSKAFVLMGTGEITARQYACVLRQVFHYVRESSQTMTLACSHFRGAQRAMIKTLMRHATSESGHEFLALHDIAALGEDTTNIPFERPLPATFALTASIFHLIEHHEPLSILGYMFQLEYTPTQVGPKYIAALERAGIPRTAMTFLGEHSEVDVAHCKLLAQYCKTLIRTPEQLESVLYARRVTAELYAEMLDKSIEFADRWKDMSPLNPEELRHAPSELAATG
ncbi:MAG: iron-containing redox enzyme family protein [Planctomycetes bacterium]|nr:iron-containing redox enzyme family protein [Planctomycetota bacterium]